MVITLIIIGASGANKFPVIYLSCGYTQVFDLYGVGLRQTFPTPNLLKGLNLKVLLPCYMIWVAQITENLHR